MNRSLELKEQMINSAYDYVPKEHREHTSVASFLKHHIAKSKSSKKDIFVAIDIPESIGYKYISGGRVVPRDVFLKFSIFFKFELEELQLYLLNFGYANLYILNQRDNAIMFCVLQNYSYLEAKQYLSENDILAL